MYSINNKKIKGKFVNKDDVLSIKGFSMGSSKKVFNIDGCDIKGIELYDKKLANPIVSSKVLKQYNKLITNLTQLLIDTDDSDDGDTYHEVLNQIEKFRLIIKNKYRDFLKKKELEMMSKHLKILQKEAQNRLIELNNFNAYESVNNRRR